VLFNISYSHSHLLLYSNLCINFSFPYSIDNTSLSHTGAHTDANYNSTEVAELLLLKTRASDVTQHIRVGHDRSGMVDVLVRWLVGRLFWCLVGRFVGC
jgi:hypothetical protein